ncbi:Cof-type HAD-IIB family hydrolase [uncultured Clostridium sp.]|uniref:Cof-type HAD-IIB family hydrolase n=1 Tax=uncultured Clostridium sp. TaxID=59620 RepID=UPI002627E8F1|nr:Cof-type HAD-IIB family hydrolase [uncultured Clostridium sp.]
MTIKLICTDMDGTLLNDDHTISTENKEALKYAIKEGVIVAITTGRLFTSANYYRSLTGINAPIISSNGAYIRDKISDEVIYENPLSLDESLELYNSLKDFNFNFFFNTFNTAISNKEFIENHPYEINNRDIKYIDEKTLFLYEKDLTSTLKDLDGHILKAICVDYAKTNKDDILMARKIIEDTNKYEVVCSNEYNFEIMKKGTTKGSAVENLAKRLSIPLSEVMCIGDGENDLSMLKIAGTSVAMGNAPEYVKEAATFITDSNNNSGVAKAIYKYIK